MSCVSTEELAALREVAVLSAQDISSGGQSTSQLGRALERLDAVRKP